MFISSLQQLGKKETALFNFQMSSINKHINPKEVAWTKNHLFINKCHHTVTGGSFLSATPRGATVLLPSPTPKMLNSKQGSSWLNRKC